MAYLLAFKESIFDLHLFYTLLFYLFDIFTF
uniref:Uncharacterized protein n=1 Tax=Siphoviridae sp. ct4be24 TaxID=2826289 RepID=A0A8S5QRB5_9CAUD|nr:MAG TPA: hypothetical protein [Siphoviridae sp. ct4be24]